VSCHGEGWRSGWPGWNAPSLKPHVLRAFHRVFFSDANRKATAPVANLMLGKTSGVCRRSFDRISLL